MIRPDNSFLIDVHYEDLGVQEAWNTRRVERLCSLMNITSGELASMLMFPHVEMNKCLEEGSFPGPGCLLLTMVENYIAGNVVPDPINGNLMFVCDGL